MRGHRYNREWTPAADLDGEPKRTAGEQQWPASTAKPADTQTNSAAAKAIESQANRVERFLRSKLANPADAQDLAQEAYLRLLRANEPQLIQDPAAYLFRIARNLVGEFYTKLPPVTNSLDEVELLTEGMSVEALAESDQQIDRLSEVLAHLSPKCRAALVLHRRDGMTVNEIAEELAVSVGSVKKYLTEGLARCRARLRRFHE